MCISKLYDYFYSILYHCTVYSYSSHYLTVSLTFYYFSTTLSRMNRELDAKNVKVVDTTCPWVAKVWNTVHTHQVRGLTSVIHGKYGHEETMATKIMCETYICVKNLDEAEYLADFMINAKEGGVILFERRL